MSFLFLKRILKIFLEMIRFVSVYEMMWTFSKAGLFTKVVSVSKRRPVYENSVSFQREPCLRKQCQFPKGALFTKAVSVSKRRLVYESSASFQKTPCLRKQRQFSKDALLTKAVSVSKRRLVYESSVSFQKEHMFRKVVSVPIPTF